MRRLKITLFIILISKLACSQTYFENSGVKLGLLYKIGQPVHRLGASAGFFLIKEDFQLVSSHVVFYAFRNYGPNLKRWETQNDFHLSFGFGNKINNQENVSMLSPVSNFTSKRNVIGYGIKFYFDKIETKQLTGNISFRTDDYFLTIENDGFVFLPFDKYRTGAISFGKYFNNSSALTEAFAENRISLDILLYTGQTQGSPTQRINDGNYPSRYGYKKLNDSKYSEASHGILQLSWQSNLPYTQNASVSIGIDNEHIRNFVQNKIIHDLPFLPKKWNKIKNPHVPMRDKEGNDYLFKENQQVRSGKFVWSVGFNQPLFY